MAVDAVVNPSNENLWPGGGVDDAIHNAAGPGLLVKCQTPGGCPVGEARITDAFGLPSRYIIHTAGPRWRGGTENEEQLLISCYRNCLRLAKENNCETVAFPLISSGTYGYPKDRVLKVAISTISDFLFENEMLVYIAVFDKESYEFSEKLFADVTEYVDDNYVFAHMDIARSNMYFRYSLSAKSSTVPEEDKVWFCASTRLDDMINNLDEPFSVMLLKLIDKKGMTDVECYKKSNVSKKTFWKIVNQKDYRPGKNTVLCFAVGLGLTLEETQSLLKTVGFTLSHSSKFDVVVEYFISNGIYDIFEINEALFKFDLPCLGGVTE